MLYEASLIVGSMLITTIVWYFILRNNKKNFNLWMDSTEIYLANALSKIDGISDEAKTKIDAIFADFKNIKK